MTIEEIHVDWNDKSPKFLQMADAVSDWIRESRVLPGTKLPGERILADVFSTTPVTVGKGLNELVRRGVLRRSVGSGTYVAGTGVMPEKLRIGLVSHEPILPDEGGWVSPIISAVYLYWQKLGGDILTLLRKPEEYEAVMREYSLSGIIVLTPAEAILPKIAEYAGKGFPVVSIGIQDPENPDICMGTNHSAVAEDVVSYLAARGHRRIALASSGNVIGEDVRRKGYMKAMFEAKLPVDPDWIVNLGEPESDMAEKVLRGVFASSNPPTAFMLTSHREIRPFYSAVKKLGKRIPEDISVIGFDDPGYARELTPPLTVFAQPMAEICRNASLQLENLIRKYPLAAFRNPSAVVIERKSCFVFNKTSEGRLEK